MIRLKKIRESAQGQECTVNSPWCNYNPETVVFAHYGEPGEKGMGIKPDDTSGAYACSSCHDWLDGRTHHLDASRTVRLEDGIHGHTQAQKDYYWFRGMRRTWKLLVEEGVLK